MNDDNLSRENSCNSLSSYDADDLVPTQVSPPEKFNEKIVDFLKCICCDKRRTT